MNKGHYNGKFQLRYKKQPQKGEIFIMNKILRVLVVFSILGGVLQIIATFGFGYQYQMGHDTMAVAVTVGLINLCSHILILLGLVAIFLYSYQRKASLNLLISFIAVF